MVELTNICNLRCPLCPVSEGLRRPKGMMDYKLFRKIVDQLDDRFVQLFIPVMWGESLLHPQFLDCISYARRKRWKISVSTHGNITEKHFSYENIVKCGIDEIIVAVDGHNQESYSIYRKGGELKKVLEFLRGIKAAKIKRRSRLPFVIAQIHLMRFNEDYLNEISSLVHEYVDEVRTKKLRIFFPREDKEKLKIYNMLRPLKPNNCYIPPVKIGLKGCTSMLYGVYISWNGDVLACCGDPNGEIVFGNIEKNKLFEIRKAPHFVKLKHQLLEGIFEKEICKKCWFHF